MSDFITKKGDHTLETIAIEVGLRKLQAKQDPRHSLYSYMSKICQKRYSREEVVAAAFPFKIKSDTFNNYYEIVSRNSSGGWKRADGVHGAFTVAAYTLVDPMLATKVGGNACSSSGGVCPGNNVCKLPENTGAEPKDKVCSCGAFKCGSPFHSDWCDGK